METRTVVHPQLGPGRLLKTYMGGHEWEVAFETGRRFRLPAREFAAESVDAWQQRLGGAWAAIAPRVATLETDQFRARQTLEALRLGIVPAQDVETLTIGLEAEQVSLQRALEGARERGGEVEAIIGDYGFGKSHFVDLAARRALRENFLVAQMSLDLVEAPPSKATEIYAALTHSLRYPDSDERGLRPLLARAPDHPAAVAEIVASAPRGAACPLAQALGALADCGSQSAADAIVAWLGGQARPTAEMKTCLRRPAHLYRTGDVARQYSYLLTGLSYLATLLGYSGLAVLIDESEHYSLLRANQRDRADAFFKAMIYAALGPAGRVDPLTIPDHPRAEYPVAFASQSRLFFLFALTESENRLPVDVWLKPSQIIRLDDRFIERDIAQFVQTLLRYHSIAYGYAYPPVDGRFEETLRATPGLLSRALAQHRLNIRELIRLAVTACDLLYLYAAYVPATLLDELARGLRVERPA
ncbi:MAG: DUF2791 family P-loop domain-containing protein [Chloroflexi bacterium]|nr:DUF2791 family P-loop domain-containing protein [Chloroflexota bacterium]